MMRRAGFGPAWCKAPPGFQPGAFTNFRHRRVCPGSATTQPGSTYFCSPTAVLKVYPGLMPNTSYPMRSAAEMARKHGRQGLSLRDLLRADPSLVPGHAWNERYVIDQ